MTQNKTAAPVQDATATLKTLPKYFTTDSEMNACDRIAAGTLMSEGGWRGNYNKLTTCARTFRRLKRKAERLGRPLKAYEVGGEL